MSDTLIHSHVPFWTPLVFDPQNRSCKETVIEVADSYFNWWCGRKASVFEGTQTRLVDDTSSSHLITLLKIISAIIVPIIPIVMLIIKACLRHQSNFEIVGDRTINLISTNPSTNEFDQRLDKIIELIQKNNPNTSIRIIENIASAPPEKEIYVLTTGPLASVFSPEGQLVGQFDDWINAHQNDGEASLHYVDPVTSPNQRWILRFSEFERLQLENTQIQWTREPLRLY